jgi:anthranilate synthase component II
LILVVDNFDSFTYNLVDYLKQLNQETEVFRNNLPLEVLLSERYSSVVLSPGPGKPSAAGNLMSVIDNYAGNKPILGICLGHQAIVEFFGGTLKKAIRPMHGKISKVINEGDAIFNNIPEIIEVTRYHSLVCDEIPDQLSVISRSIEGEVMALKHKKMKIYGLQYHPEAVFTSYGLEILHNWLNINSTSD